MSNVLLIFIVYKKIHNSIKYLNQNSKPFEIFIVKKYNNIIFIFIYNMTLKHSKYIANAITVQLPFNHVKTSNHLDPLPLNLVYNP